MDSIRRPARRGDLDAFVNGFVVSPPLVKTVQSVEGNINQHVEFVFESADVPMAEVKATALTYLDGSPAVIPET